MKLYSENTGQKLVVLGEARRADVLHRIPVEAEALDADGVRIHVLLHVVDGYLDEIEFYRDDGEPIERIPDPNQLVVTATQG